MRLRPGAGARNLEPMSVSDPDGLPYQKPPIGSRTDIFSDLQDGRISRQTGRGSNGVRIQPHLPGIIGLTLPQIDIRLEIDDHPASGFFEGQIHDPFDQRPARVCHGHRRFASTRPACGCRAGAFEQVVPEHTPRRIGRFRNTLAWRAERTALSARNRIDGRGSASTACTSRPNDVPAGRWTPDGLIESNATSGS